MSSLEKQPSCTDLIYLVNHNDLPLSCPTNEMILWNAHPKVYLSFGQDGRATCPYCSARYILEYVSHAK